MAKCKITYFPKIDDELRDLIVQTLVEIPSGNYIVSTTGGIKNHLGIYMEIGAGRYFETMVFPAEKKNGKWDFSSHSEIDIGYEGDWCVSYIDPFENAYNKALKIHENHVKFLSDNARD